MNASEHEQIVNFTYYCSVFKPCHRLSAVEDISSSTSNLQINSKQQQQLQQQQLTRAFKIDAFKKKCSLVYSGLV